MLSYGFDKIDCIKRLLYVLVLILIHTCLSSQVDSLSRKLSFEMDYRFRIEQDWNSRKSDGTFREDRSRLRYRLRAGAKYSEKEYSFGFRIRTGDPKKQQDPQLTLGKGLKEFGTLPIGFEKVYFQYKKNNFKFWLGKNTFPFKKYNELFWSDNVFPEGVSFSKRLDIRKGLIKSLDLAGAHFILASNDDFFFNDAFFQGFQASINTINNRFEILSSYYRLRNIPNIPDGEHSYLLPYSILHFAGKMRINKISIESDFYYNLENYNDSNVANEFVNHKTGYVFGIQYGSLDNAKQWKFKLTYAYLERYSILDYMAQNDWARWDYASFNSPDGRLSNLQGVEAVVAYSLTDKIKLVTKYYFVDQLIPFNTLKENGQRIRFDIDVKL